MGKGETSLMTEFRILGPVRIYTDGHEDTVNGSKQRTMLAALLLAEGRTVSDDHLSQMLWGEHPPATAPAQIHTYASRIRQHIHPDIHLERIRTGYRMPTTHYTLDYHTFHTHVQAARHATTLHNHTQAAHHLHHALNLWQGDPLADTTEHMTQTEQPHLQEQRLEALELRIEADLILGRQNQLIPELHNLVTHHPLREQLRALLMTALYRAERQADAIALFQDCRRILNEQLGVPPGHLLTRTYQSLLTGEARSHLPQQLTIK
jgi:DNA-binding SARP family transcriptional activator